MRIIAIGSGSLVYFLAKQFASKGYPLTLIVPNAAEATALSRRLKATVIVGDGSSPQVLENAEAYRADVLLALMPNDADNLLACQAAQKRFDIPRTIALVSDPDNQAIFEQLGVSVAISTTSILLGAIGRQAETAEFRNLTPLTSGEAVGVHEVTLSEAAPAVGKTIEDVELPGTAIASIVRENHLVRPEKWQRLHRGDRLVVVSQADSYGPLLRNLSGETAS